MHHDLWARRLSLPYQKKEETFCNVNAAASGSLRRIEDNYVKSIAAQKSLNCQHGGCVNAITFTDDTELLATGSDDTTIGIWRTSDWSSKSRFSTAHHANIFSLAFVPRKRGSNILSCGLDGRVVHSDLEAQSTTSLVALPGYASKVIFPPGSTDRVFVASTARQIVSVDLREQPRNPSVGMYPVHPGVGGVTTLACTERYPNILAVGGDVPQVFLFDIRMMLATFDGSSNTAHGRNSSLPRRGRPIQVLDVPVKARPRRMRLDNVEVTSLNFSNDGASILANCKADDVVLFNWLTDTDVTSVHFPTFRHRKAADAGYEPLPTNEPSSPMDSVRFGDDDDVEESASEHFAEDDMIENTAGDLLKRYPLSPDHPPPKERKQPRDDQVMRYSGRTNVRTMFKEAAFFHDDKYILTGGDCGFVYFWRRETGELVHKIQGDNEIVNGVLTHPRLPVIIACGIDSTAKVLFSNGKLNEVACASTELFADGAIVFPHDSEWSDGDSEDSSDFVGQSAEWLAAANRDSDEEAGEEDEDEVGGEDEEEDDEELDLFGSDDDIGSRDTPENLRAPADLEEDDFDHACQEWLVAMPVKELHSTLQRSKEILMQFKPHIRNCSIFVLLAFDMVITRGKLSPTGTAWVEEALEGLTEAAKDCPLKKGLSEFFQKYKAATSKPSTQQPDDVVNDLRFEPRDADEDDDDGDDDDSIEEAGEETTNPVPRRRSDREYFATVDDLADNLWPTLMDDMAPWADHLQSEADGVPFLAVEYGKALTCRTTDRVLILGRLLCNVLDVNDVITRRALRSVEGTASEGMEGFRPQDLRPMYRDGSLPLPRSLQWYASFKLLGMSAAVAKGNDGEVCAINNDLAYHMWFRVREGEGESWALDIHEAKCELTRLTFHLRCVLAAFTRASGELRRASGLLRKARKEAKKVIAKHADRNAVGVHGDAHERFHAALLADLAQTIAAVEDIVEF